MNCPEHLEISIKTVFQLFSHQDAQILTHLDILELLNFVFSELGLSRSADQTDLVAFLSSFSLQSCPEIEKQHFGNRQFLNFNRSKVQNFSAPELTDIKIPVQPFVAELESVGCQFIERDRVRQFLVSINSLLQIPKPVQDSDVQKFITDFDRNGDGQLQTQDLKGIQFLKFSVKKCRRYE